MPRASIFGHAVLACFLFLFARSPVGEGAGANAAEPLIVDVMVVDGRAQGGDAPIRVTRGTRVLLRWHVDRPTEIHLHGYDIEIAVRPGTAGEMSVEADATGRFPITSHAPGGGHVTLQYLEVHPR